MDKRPTAKIELDFPIEISGVKVEHLVMRRPKVRDEMAMAKSTQSDADKALLLIANLCEVAPDDLLELDAADWQKLEQQVVSFREAKS